MAITIPELNRVNTLDDTDDIMLTHSNGNSEKISGSALKADMIKDKIENNNGNAVSVNAVSTILATSTTITGPELGTGGNIKILFTSAIAGVDTSTGMSLTYNGDTIAVKVGKDGALEDFKAVEVSTGVYRYLQAYTTLELVFDGTYLIIVGNPVVLSGSTYTILADGTRLDQPIDSIASGESRPVTSGSVYTKTSILNCIKQGYKIYIPNYYAGLFAIKVYGMDIAVYAFTTAGNTNQISLTRIHGGALNSYFERKDGYLQFVTGYEGRMIVIMQEPA